MLLVVPPKVIVPLLMLHAYVAPVPAVATDAVLPVDKEHTDEAAVIDAFGAAAIVIVFLADATLQPPLLVTVTDIVTVPDPPAV